MLIVRDMKPEDEYFVSTCSHVNESEEIDRCGARRRSLFLDLREKGSLFKVALLTGKHAGFAYGIPIEHAAWGPLGEDLLVIPCLYVLDEATGRGVGRTLIGSIEKDARAMGRKGVTVTAYKGLYGADWFMPASYFERLGYKIVAERQTEVLLWKRFTPDVEAPHFLQPNYEFRGSTGRVVVDLFWNAFCQTSDIEAERVREVCAEFGDRVVLNEYPAEDRSTLLAYQIPRAIFVDGKEISWGYEAPQEGIRAALRRALASSDTRGMDEA